MSLIQRKNVGDVQPGVDPDGLPVDIYSTQMYTITTSPGGTRTIYNAEAWVKIRMRLDTVGPVDIGTREKLDPVLSGQGITLQTEDWTEFVLSKGDRLSYTSNTVDRFQVIVEPIPYSRQILDNLIAGFEKLAGISRTSARLLGAIVKVGAARRKAIADPNVPCPPSLR